MAGLSKKLEVTNEIRTEKKKCANYLKDNKTTKQEKVQYAKVSTSKKQKTSKSYGKMIIMYIIIVKVVVNEKKKLTKGLAKHYN